MKYTVTVMEHTGGGDDHARQTGQARRWYRLIFQDHEVGRVRMALAELLAWAQRENLHVWVDSGDALAADAFLSWKGRGRLSFALPKGTWREPRP